MNEWMNCLSEWFNESTTKTVQCSCWFHKLISVYKESVDWTNTLLISVIVPLGVTIAEKIADEHGSANQNQGPEGTVEYDIYNLI